jgi:hypothetical protein
VAADTNAAASALSDALVALRQAERAVESALASLAGEPSKHRPIRPGQRTTTSQILTTLTKAGEPLTLAEIAAGVVAVRTGLQDAPRKNGGTVWQENCRKALSRLIEQGVVVRVPPADRTGFMTFALPWVVQNQSQELRER